MGDGLILGFKELLTAVAGFSVTLITILTYFSGELKDKATVQDLIHRIESRQGIQLYRAFVNKLLTTLEKIFGKALSLQAFGVCFILAFAYPAIFFIVAYSWGGGSHEFAGEAVFDLNSSFREWYLPAIAAFLFGFIYLLKNTERIDRYSTNLLASWFDSQVWAEQSYKVLCALLVCWLVSTFNSSIWYLLLGLWFGYTSKAVAVAVAVAFAFAGAFAGAFAFTGAVAVAVAGAFAFAFAFAVAVAFAFAVAVAVAFAVWGFYQESYSRSLTYSILLVMLPILNATLDWLSWWFSRIFLKRASQEDSVLMIARDVLFDLVIAIGFMLLLCLALPIGIELINSIYAPYAPESLFDWGALAQDAKDDPWGKGLMVTLMIVTTMIPTVLHVLLGLIAVILHSFLGKPFVNQLNQYLATKSNVCILFANVILTAYSCGVLLFLYVLYSLGVMLLHLDIPSLLYGLSMWGVEKVGL